MLMCLSYANSALTALQARPRIQRKASGFWNLLIFPPVQSNRISWGVRKEHVYSLEKTKKKHSKIKQTVMRRRGLAIAAVLKGINVLLRYRSTFYNGILINDANPLPLIIMIFIMTYPHHNHRLQSSKTNRLRMPGSSKIVFVFLYQIKVQSNFELKSQGSILPLLVRLMVISFICGQWSSTSMPERAPLPNSISPSRHQLEKRWRERWWEGGGKQVWER